MVEYNPYAYETHEDPYPIYARLREEAPLYRNDELGFWAVSRYEDVLRVLRDPVRFSSTNGVSLDPASNHPGAEATMSFLAMDPPRHTRMRNLVSRGFTPRRVSGLEAHIRDLAAGYLDRIREDGGCEFVADFAGKLPMDVVSEMLGVPPEDRDTLRNWAELVVHREEGMMDVPPAGMQAAAHMLQYFGELVTDREKHPRDDLTGALLAAEIDGDRLSSREVLGFLFLMVIAGNETTTKLLANSLYWLARNPGERAKVAADPSLIEKWAEETLRYDSSTQALARTVTEDTELHGRTMRAGDRIAILIGSANRDLRVWPDPDRFDIERNTSASLSFGNGTHFCMGASLARLETRVALEEFWKRMADYTVVEDGIERIHSINVRGFAALPLEFGR